MQWNEKINLLKKKYTQDDFSVPNVNRKAILRKIETKFVKRDDEYYHPNNLNERFSNWWEYLDSSEVELTNINFEKEDRW